MPDEAAPPPEESADPPVAHDRGDEQVHVYETPAERPITFGGPPPEVNGEPGED